LLFDYHVHPDYSIDATGSMMEYCETALRLNLGEICFTTHYDLHPERKNIDGFVRRCGKIIPVTEEWLPAYLKDITRADAIYRGKGLRVKAGLEIDFHPDLAEKIAAIAAEYPFDYFLGAVHCLERFSIAVPTDCAEYYSGKTAAEVCAVYYEILAQAVGSGLFDAIAHLDLYKKFATPHLGEAVATAHRGLLEPVLAEMAKRGTGIEINTKNWYKGLPEASPSPDILRLCRKSGIEVVTLGSDCHRPADLGRGIARAAALAQEIGFKSLFTFDAHRAVPITI
jgi:histidinol-phosphatase (PHP family)